MSLILFNKPFQVMCQFSPHPTYQSLTDYLDLPNIYPAGRLDADSEGLMLLTDDGGLQHAISHPQHEKEKTYLVQVEGKTKAGALEKLRAPINLGDFTTRACKAVQVTHSIQLWVRRPRWANC